jgi:hypothetical protein
MHYFLMIPALWLALTLRPANAANTSDSAIPPTVLTDKRGNGIVDMTITTRVPAGSKELAIERAVLTAQEEIPKLYTNPDHPLLFVPSREFILTKLKKSESFTEVDSGSTDIGLLYNVTLTLEIPAQMEQQFRKAGRVVSGFWGLGCAVAALIVVGLFFRMDEWTKGYLTTWLALLSVGIISGLGVFWFLVH